MTLDMLLTWAAVAALLMYAYGLGAAAWLVWHRYPGPLRWAPAGVTLLYYYFAWNTHPPAFAAVLNGIAYPAGDSLRGITASLAFGLSLLLLARLASAKGKK